MTTVSIREALQRVADRPRMEDDEDLLQLPVHEIVCRNLFEIANTVDARQRGSLSRANKARKMILERLVGKRKTGTHPATREPMQVTFVDLTGGELET